MDITQHQKVVLNDASVGKVAGWFFLLGLPVALVISRRVWFIDPIFPLLLLPFLLAGGLAVERLFLYGKSITVLPDRIIVERWLSKVFHLNRRSVIYYSEIQNADYKQKNKGFPIEVTTYKLTLNTSKGRFVFSWRGFEDEAELRYVRAILTEKLGRGKVQISIA